MWQSQARLCAILVLTGMFAGCGSISSPPTGSTPPGNTQPQNIFVAANFPGADCGAKIVAANAAADENGIIEVTPVCGTTWTTQVVVRPSHTLRVEDGTYQITRTVLLHGACIQGQNAALAVTKPVDFVSNADASNSNLCVQNIGLSGAAISSGQSRGVHFKNVHGFTISGVDFESMVTHGVFIDDGSDNGQIVNNKCHGVIQGSCYLAGNGPGLATVANINISNNTASEAHANSIFVIGSKNGQPTKH